MPIQPNFLERTAFFTLNAAPVPMLDLAGALAFQAVNTAVHLNLFAALQERPFTPHRTGANPQLPGTRAGETVGRRWINSRRKIGESLGTLKSDWSW